MAQDQLLVSVSGMPNAACIPAPAESNGADIDSSNNSTPDSGMHDDDSSSAAISVDPNDTAISSMTAGDAEMLTTAVSDDRHNGHGPPSEQEHQPAQQQQQAQHVVHVHVNPGETFRVRMGNQVQQIKGPATVRMVSSSGPPPLPMPRLQQPPGHVIQQLMDENGVLTHVILSPQPPSIGHTGGTVPMSYINWESDMQSQHPMQQFMWNGSGQSMQPFYPPPHFSNNAGQYTPSFHHHPMTGAPAHVQAPAARMMPAGSSSGRTVTAIQPSQHATPAPVPQPYSDDRISVRKRRQGQDRQQRRGGSSSAVGGGGGGGGGGGSSCGNGHGGGNSRLSHNTPPRWRTGAAALRNEVTAAGAGAATVAPVNTIDPTRASSSSSGLPIIGDHQHPVQLLPPRSLFLSRPTVSVINIEARRATIHIIPPEPPASPAQEKSRQPASTDADAAAGGGIVTTGSVIDVSDPVAGSSDVTAGAPESDVVAVPAAVTSSSDGALVAETSAATSSERRDGQQEMTCGVPEGIVATPDFLYTVKISEQKKDGIYKIFYHGEATEIVVEDLKPASDYFVKVGASLANLRWPETEPVLFRTICCAPEPPSPPTMVSRTRNNVTLRWAYSVDNGSKITAFSLEMDQGDGNFVEVFNGLQRTFKATKLHPSTGYIFRLAAVNAVGKSDYSEAVQYVTSGSMPETPDRPQLARATCESLTLFWFLPASSAPHSSSGDDAITYCLQMEEEWTQHGFRAVYNGSELKYTVDRLRRNSDYKFRVCATNEEGSSKWSPVAIYRTLPDNPSATGRPQTKGKVNPMSFRLTWDPPRDTGGSAVDKYVVQLDYGADFEEVYCGSANECTCTELHPGFAYRARVACRSAAGLQGPWSEPTVITTPPVVPIACPQPRLNGRARPQSIDIRWSAPDYDGGAKVTEYRVQLSEEKPSTMTGAVSGSDLDNNPSSFKEVYRAAAQPGNMSCTIASLVAGHSYLVQVRAVNKAGEGPWSEALRVTTGAAPPSQPAVPQCIVRTAHSVVASWNEPASNGSSITEYRLYCALSDDDAASKMSDGSQPTAVAQPAFSQVYAGPSVTHEVKGLLPSTSYLFKVEAVNSAGVSEPSLVASCRTAASVPGPVTDVMAIYVRATEVQLQWRVPASHGSQIVGYEVFFDDNSHVVSGDIAICAVGDLQPQTAYKIRVRAINGVGHGPFSTPAIKVTTSPLPPPAPELESTAVTSNSIKLRWTAVTSGQLPYPLKAAKVQNNNSTVASAANGDSVTYTLLMLREGRSAVVLYTGAGLMHKVNKLAENTAHKFQVYATNAAGNGQLSDVVTVVTAKAQPPAVKAPCASHVTPSSVQLAWPACLLRVTAEDSIVYVVQLSQIAQRETGAAPVYEERYRGPELSCTLAGLEPSANYLARVAPLRVCSDGGSVVAGAFSPAVEFQTSSDAVSPAVGSESAEGDTATRGTAVVEKLRQAAHTIAVWPMEHAAITVVSTFIAICSILIAILICFFGL